MDVESDEGLRKRRPRPEVKSPLLERKQSYGSVNETGSKRTKKKKATCSQIWSRAKKKVVLLTLLLIIYLLVILLRFRNDVNLRIALPVGIGVWALLVFIAVMKSRKTPPPRFPLWPEKEEREALIDEIEEWLSNRNIDSRIWVSHAYKHLQRRIADNHEKRILAIVNPVSGSGASKHFYYGVFEPVLKKMGFRHFEVRETEHVGHGTEIVQDFDLETVDAIAIVGGDGTYAEVYKALKHHKSGQDRLDFPVAILPGGGSWIFSQLDEYIDPLHPAVDRDIISAALRVAAWKAQPHDILEYEIQTEEGETKRDFLIFALMHGLFSGLTKTASNLRWTKLGVKRYPIAMIVNWLKGHHFPVDFSYLPENSEEQAPSFEDWQETDEWVSESGDFKIMNLWVSFLKFDPRDSRKTCNDGLVWIHIVRNLSRIQMLKRVISKKIEFWRYDGSPLPEGVNIQGVKAITIKPNTAALSQKDLWKQGEIVVDGEPEPLPYLVKEFRGRIGDSKAMVFM